MTTPAHPRRAVPVAPSLAILTVVAAHATGAAAQSETDREQVACELDDMTRLISLRVDPEAGYVCDVLYEKPDEGDTREVLWSARNTVDYCRPRYTGLVEDLSARGWTCDYAEGSGGEPAVAAATRTRNDDDETTSEGTRGKFRDWCIADAVNAPSVEGRGPVKGYCDCVARGMDSHGLTEEDAQVIFDGLSAVPSGGEAGDPQDLDKRLNTLATNYDTVVEFCS